MRLPNAALLRAAIREASGSVAPMAVVGTIITARQSRNDTT